MKNAFIVLAASTFIACLAWLAVGAVLTALAAGLVTFLFALLGSLCHASDIRIDDVYGRDGAHSYDAGKGEFGGMCVSGSWK